MTNWERHPTVSRQRQLKIVENSSQNRRPGNTPTQRAVLFEPDGNPQNSTMNYELMAAGPTKVSFRPIDSDLWSDSLGEPTVALDAMNKSIFREADHESPPSTSLSRANPIRSSNDDEDIRETGECNERIITPYPYSSQSQLEIEERQHLTTQLGFDWTVRESIPLKEDYNFAMAKEDRMGEARSVDYSFFFENVPASQEVSSDVEDDVSFAYDDDSILDDEGLFVEQSEPISPSIWDRDVSSSPSQTRRGGSPAQVSVGSDTEDKSPPNSPATSPKKH